MDAIVMVLEEAVVLHLSVPLMFICCNLLRKIVLEVATFDTNICLGWGIFSDWSRNDI
jgi:hypothetical protein